MLQGQPPGSFVKILGALRACVSAAYECREEDLMPEERE